VIVRMVLESPDRRFRVEVVQRGGQVSYRLLRDGEVWQEKTGIGAIEHLLQREGVSMADLVAVEAEPSQHT
jgi:hypothetical protein